MIEAAQVRAARALIGWPQARLADAAGVPLADVERFESGASGELPADAIARMQAALEAAGVAFIARNGGGAGVRLRKGRDSQTIAFEDLNASNDE
jgi:transcriptional regulator with XRE-family HTH domain